MSDPICGLSDRDETELALLYLGVSAVELSRWLTFAAAGMGDDALWERRYGSAVVSVRLAEQAKRAARLAKQLSE